MRRERGRDAEPAMPSPGAYVRGTGPTGEPPRESAMWAVRKSTPMVYCVELSRVCPDLRLALFSVYLTQTRSGSELFRQPLNMAVRAGKLARRSAA